MDPHPPERVTPGGRSGAWNDQLLYFTSSSLTDDGRLVVLSDRTGGPNLFSHDLKTGVERQLSDNRAGTLRSYVYFDADERRGLGKASVCLHAASGVAFYLQDDQLYRADPGRPPRVLVGSLAREAGDVVTAFTHVSADGRRVCVPVTDADALAGPLRDDGQPAYDVDARVRSRGLASRLLVFDAHSGERLASVEVPRAWVTHVQFSPVDADLILYNHEWPDDCGVRRMWLLDLRTGEHRPLRTEGPGRSRGDWTCHEMWERDGSAVIYHGGYADGRSYVGRVVPGHEPTEVPLPDGFDRYGHFTVGGPGVLVSDGHYEQPGDPPPVDPPGHGAWICRVEVNWDGRRTRWVPLCRSGSSWGSQDAHPHPILDAAGKWAYFTSDREGRRAVYRVRADG